MTDPAATIERVLGEHLLAPTISIGAYWGCSCGNPDFGPCWSDPDNRHLPEYRAHVAAEIVKALISRIDAWESEEVMYDVLVPGAWSDGVRYGLTVARYIISDPNDPQEATQEPRQRPRTAGGHTETVERETGA